MRPIRKGDEVADLPGARLDKKGDQRLWLVKAIHKRGDAELAELELLDAEASETQTVALADLVVVAEFRDTIYPALGKHGPCTEWR